MKILLLQHTSWIEMMGESWNEIPGVEIVILPLPVADWDDALRRKVAGIIPEFAKAHNVKMIVDVNALGILPVDKEEKVWTTDLVDLPWITWWWDSPRHIWNSISSYGYRLNDWKSALEKASVSHFIWDGTLGKEFEHYIDKTFTLLPSATHPGMFHPDAKEFSTQHFEKRDVSFLGTYYSSSVNKCEDTPLLNAHITYPTKTFLELTKEFDDTAFSLLDNDSGFSTELTKWVNQMNLQTGGKLRNTILNEIASSDLLYRFIGFNFPEKINVERSAIYAPTDLVACFHSSTVILDLGNTQSFSGTAMRCYEVMASGSVLACNKPLDFDPMGKYDGELYVRFSTVDDLKEIIEKLNGAPELKKQIGENARQFILDNHTWNHRLLSIINYITVK